MAILPESEEVVDLGDYALVPLGFAERASVAMFCHELGNPEAWMGVLRLLMWMGRNEQHGCIAELTSALPALTGLSCEGERIDHALRVARLVDASGVLVDFHSMFRERVRGYPLWWETCRRFGAYMSPFPSVMFEDGEAEASPHRDPISAKLRAAVLARDGMVCRYCGEAANKESSEEIDHIIPRSRGGANTMSNLVVACRPCNRQKHARTPDEAGMRLRPVAVKR